MDPSLTLFSITEDQVFLPSRLSPAEKERVTKDVAKHFRGHHVWLLSSGTESARAHRLKVVALSLQAIKAAAHGVVTHFGLEAKDVLLNLLPLYHVSGLMQKARAEVSGACWIDHSSTAWDENEFVSLVQQKGVTVTSLVPTQIYDLVRAQLQAPLSLKVVFVGGGALSEDLLQKALNLGWPLVRTYGMTETCAMIGYQNKNEVGYRKLPHMIDWRCDEQGRLSFLSPSLLSGYLWVGEESAEWQDPKERGWYLSDDRGLFQDGRLILLSRDSELVKIKGESVSLAAINEKWQTWFSQNSGHENSSIIIAIPHDRDGSQLILISETPITEEKLSKFHQTVLPFERLQKVITHTIPRNELGKIKIAELKNAILSRP